MYAYVCVLRQKRGCSSKNKNIYIYIYIHICIHTYTSVYMHNYIYMRVCVCLSNRCSSKDNVEQSSQLKCQLTSKCTV